MSDLHARLATIEARAAEWSGRTEQALKQYDRLRDQLQDAHRSHKLAADAHGLLMATIDSQREVVRERMEKMVASALRSVFGKGMDFRFDITTRRGVANFEPQIGYRRKAEAHWAGVGEVGGGMVDVLAFVLRVCVLLMVQPARPRLLVLDEPFKHVSSQYLPAVAMLVKSLADDMGIQFVIVSHEPEVAGAADRVFKVTKEPGGASVVTPQ